nr:hypothetical protein SHINE37_44825 [Rhizobiaceae bacterium]
MAGPKGPHGLSGGVFDRIRGKGRHAAPARLLLLPAGLASSSERPFKDFPKRRRTLFTAR